MLLTISIESYHDLGHMLCIKGIKGPQQQFFDPVYLENKNNLKHIIKKKSCLESCFQQYPIFILSLNGPVKELRGQPQNISFLNI